MSWTTDNIKTGQVQPYSFYYPLKKNMGSGGYKISDQGAIYFVSFAVVGWVDVFSRKDFKDRVVESLKHCQDKKGLIIYA